MDEIIILDEIDEDNVIVDDVDDDDDDDDYEDWKINLKHIFVNSENRNIAFNIIMECPYSLTDNLPERYKGLTLLYRNRRTVEPLDNEVLGTMKITLLYQVSHYIRVKNKEI